MKTEPGFEWLLPRGAQWKWSRVMLGGIYPGQGAPDSTAAGRHQSARVGGFVGIHCGSAHRYTALVPVKPDVQ